MAGWVALCAINCILIVPWLGRLWPQPRDFGIFYTAARICLHDNPHNLYNLTLQAQTQKRLYNIPAQLVSKRFLPYNHLPYEVVLFLPLANLSASQALWIWRIESICLLFFTVWLFARTFPTRHNATRLFVIALAFFPVPFCLLTGQDTFVTLALLAVSLWFYKTERYVLAGAALGLCLFKFQLVVPIIIIFLVRRSWRVILGFVSSGTVVLIISGLIVGYEGMLSLLHLWLKGETGGISCISPLTMPNIRGLVASIPGAAPEVVLIATCTLSLLLLFFVAHQSRILTSLQLFAVASCFVILVSFHTNVYDLTLLMLPILMAMDTLPGSGRYSWIVRISLFLLFSTPLYLVAFVAHKVPLVAILVGLLWYALSIAPGRQTTAAGEIRAIPSLLAATRD